MKNISKLILGLLILTPGLYAMDEDRQFEKERKTKMAHSAAAADAEYESDDEGEREEVDPVREGLIRLGKQGPEETAQANALKDAVLDSDIKRVRELLAAKADVNVRSSRNDSAIRYAFDSEILQLLINHKADVNSVDDDKKTILHWYCFKAALKKDIQGINKKGFLLLLHHGADVNATDKYGHTPLHLLVPTLYHPEATPDYVTSLLECGAHPMIVDLPEPTLSGQTCLDRLRGTLASDDDFYKHNLRVPACTMLCALDEHRKRMDAIKVHDIKDILVTCRADAFTRGVDDIVGAYVCGGLHRPDDAKLDAIFTEFAWLFKQLRESGQLPPA